MHYSNCFKNPQFKSDIIFRLLQAIYDGKQIFSNKLKNNSILTAFKLNLF